MPQTQPAEEAPNKMSRWTVKRIYIPTHASLTAVAMLAMIGPVASQPPPHKFMGTGSCSSSNCHGAVQPQKNSHVLQNEYSTWIKHDKHSKAYAALLSPEGKRMAAHLNIKDATEEPRCLKCHATYVPEASLRGEKFQIEDGVSCESCHGAAEKWLSRHAQVGATHQENMANGLADVVTSENRADLCLSCHYGNDDRFVSHELYGAGHPRLRFELDTYSILQPKHWVIDGDYLKRKEPYEPLKAWFVGQLRQANATVAALESPARSTNGALPELALFDCFSCHHSLTEEQWKSRSYAGAPGQLRLNLPSLIMLQYGLREIDASASQRLGALLAQLHLEYRQDRGKAALPEIKELIATTITADVTRILADNATCSAVLASLTSFAAHTPTAPTFEVAEQIGMGIQAAIASSPQLAQKHSQAVRKLFSTLQNAKAFKAELFTARARELYAASKAGL
jgi:hypothetical protein